jgi:Holliday junction resolvase-like predicted endonuclease
MSNYVTGHAAEKIAASYLIRHGYVVLELNWRTRYCEIDIVARRGNVISLAEVKYREDNEQGSGLEYITERKLRQMQFAAEMWVQEHGWSSDYCLAAIELGGMPPRVTDFIPQL